MADNMNPDIMRMDTEEASGTQPVDVPVERTISQLDDRSCSRSSIHFVADLNAQPDTRNSIVLNSVGRVSGCIEKMPKRGSRVPERIIKKAGPYILGPIIGAQPVHSIVQCLARHEVSKKCYTLKILTLKDSLEEETEDDRQGKMLMHSENSLLGLLEHEKGVINKHEFFKDYAFDEKVVQSKRRKKRVYTGKIKQRLCLVLDCLINHDFNLESDNFINLQDYVIREKKLSEKETLMIFYDTVRTVAAFHAKHIIHRDLKLGNLVYNLRMKKTIITNFCLGEHKSAASDLLHDQRGSPAYIAPEVLSGKPYPGKPADMWALGVMFYTMLYGQFPFYENTPSELFNQIKSVSYIIPEDIRVSEQSINIIKHLLIIQPQKRLTATQLLRSLESVIALYRVPEKLDDKSRGEQVVPECNPLNSDEIDIDAICNTPAVAAKIAQMEALVGSKKGQNFFTRYVTMQESMENSRLGRNPPLEEGDFPLVRRSEYQLGNFSPTQFRRFIQIDNQLSEDSATNSDPEVENNISVDEARDHVSMDDMNNEEGQNIAVSYLSASGADRNRNGISNRLYQLQNHLFSVNANENNATISQSARGTLSNQSRNTAGLHCPGNQEEIRNQVGRISGDNFFMYLALRNRLHNALSQYNVSESSRALLNMIFSGSSQDRLRNALLQQREQQSVRVRNSLHEMLAPYARRRSLWLSRRSSSSSSPRLPNPPPHHHPQSPMSNNQRSAININNNSERVNSNSSSRRVNPSISNDVLVPEQQQQQQQQQIRCPENGTSSSRNLRRLAREVMSTSSEALLDSELRQLLSVRLAVALATATTNNTTTTTTTTTTATTTSTNGSNNSELNGNDDRANVNNGDYG